MIAGMNIVVGIDVAKTVVGTGVGGRAVEVDVSDGNAAVCFPQAARNTRKTIQRYRRGVGFINIKKPPVLTETLYKCMLAQH